MRRNNFVEVIDKPAAKKLVRSLKPSALYLFGNDIDRACKTLKDGSELQFSVSWNKAEIHKF